MTVTIEAALEERDLLLEETDSLLNLIADKVNPLPPTELKKAMIRLAVQTNSIRFIENLITTELQKVPLGFFYYNTKTNGE